MVTKSQPHPAVTAILRRRTVEARTGLSRSTIYLRIAQGTFPKSIALGPRTIGWSEEEVSSWIAERIAERDSGRSE